MKYNEEERYLLDALESGRMKLSTPSRKEIAAVKAAADNTFRKNRSITIRLYDHDLMGIQKKAMELGMPYQTLISGIIHRYVEGNLQSSG